VKFTYVMLIHRVYDVVRSDQPYVDGSAIRPEELNLLPRYFLDDDTREDGVRQLYAAIEDWYQHPVEVS
jgi:hypothetical protein